VQTYIGDILLACNPFQDLQLYQASIQARYVQIARSQMPPHVYAVADAAYHGMHATHKSHCVIIRFGSHALPPPPALQASNPLPTRQPDPIPPGWDHSLLASGDSGAGKTVSATHIITHILYLCRGSNAGPASADATAASKPTPAHGRPSTSGESLRRASFSSPSSRRSVLASASASSIEDRILQVNPLLEAFGNACTRMNNNSSRFGKYTQLLFDIHGNVLGAAINDYLLEKSRVVKQAPGEANFHMLYYIFASPFAREWKLTTPSSFR
jgi:myosin heavy subunit